MMQVKCSGCQINDGCMVHNLKPPTVTYSHGMDFKDEVKKSQENKSWNEFIEWADEEWPYANVLHKFVYDRLLDYEKIGLLIEFVKTKNPERNMVWIGSINVEFLESYVKSLKPKEDGEIVRLANELYKAGGGNGKLDTPGGIEYWSDIAKRAIEIIKGE